MLDMGNIMDIYQKNVVVSLTDGTNLRGYVESFTFAIDNDPEEDSIGLIPSKGAKEGLELFSHEIAEIRLA